MSDPQSPADVAVVMPTMLAPSLLRAARSVLRQDFAGRVQLLIGVDVRRGDPGLLDTIRAECPPHVTLTVLDLGYSTSVRHGGLHPNAFSGALRAILTYAANSRLVAYLDDNDWYGPDHLASLADAIAGRAWAFSHRWLADPHGGGVICRDEWDSVGPGAGINAAAFGGFCHPSTLMLDKLACHFAIPLWCNALFPDGSGEDRLVFEALHKNFSSRGTGEATCFCTLNEAAIRDAHHVAEFRRRGIHWPEDRTLLDGVAAHCAAAERCLAAGRAASAAGHCEAALALHPHHPAALGTAARALACLGRTEEARHCLDAALLMRFALPADVSKDTPPAWQAGPESGASGTDAVRRIHSPRELHHALERHGAG